MRRNSKNFLEIEKKIFQTDIETRVEITRMMPVNERNNVMGIKVMDIFCVMNVRDMVILPMSVQKRRRTSL